MNILNPEMVIPTVLLFLIVRSYLAQSSTPKNYIVAHHASDYAKENRALIALAEALADSPRDILHTLANMILEVFQAGSAGIGLLTTDDGGKRFYWPAIAGRWKQHIGGGTPRNFRPCGEGLDCNTPFLIRHI